MPHIGSSAARRAAAADRVPVRAHRATGQWTPRWWSLCIHASTLLIVCVGVAACTTRTLHSPLLSAPSAGAGEPEPRSVADLAADGSPLDEPIEWPTPPICVVATSAPPSSYGEAGAAGPFFLAVTTRSTRHGRCSELRIHSAIESTGASTPRSVRSRSPPASRSA